MINHSPLNELHLRLQDQRGARLLFQYLIYITLTFLLAEAVVFLLHSPNTGQIQILIS